MKRFLQFFICLTILNQLDAQKLQDSSFSTVDSGQTYYLNIDNINKDKLLTGESFTTLTSPIRGQLKVYGFDKYVAGIKLCNSPDLVFNISNPCFNNSPVIPFDQENSFSFNPEDYGYSSQNLYMGLVFYLDPSELPASKNLSTVDLAFIKSHILGIKALSTIQRLAADVNCSKSVSPSDMVQIRQIILGISDGFNCVKNLKLLNHVQKYEETKPDSIYISTVIRMGDVSSIEPKVNGTNGKNETRDNNPVKLLVDNQIIKPDQNYKIDFYLDNELTTKALQFTLETHPAVTITKVIEGLGSDIGDNNFNLSSDGKTLTLSWNTNGQPLPTKLLLFSIILHSDISLELNKAFSLTSKVAIPQAYDEDGTVFPLNLDFIDKGGEKALTILYGPNPVTEKLNFNISLPEETNIKLFMTDVLGRTSPILMNRTYSGGNHFDSVDMVNIANGIYQVTLMLDDKVYQTKQVLIYH